MMAATDEQKLQRIREMGLPDSVLKLVQNDHDSLLAFAEFLASPAACGMTKTKADMQGWQDISTAPRDGTEILVASTYPDGRISVVANARWVESNHEPYNYFWHDIEQAMRQEDVALWMPLPPPPSKGGE